MSEPADLPLKPRKTNVDDSQKGIFYVEGARRITTSKPIPVNVCPK